jgi:hypothetical protein
MTFPADVKGCMKECVLSLIWPKQTIVDFFKQHGCTEDDLKPVAKFKELNLSRAAIIDAVFDQLSSRADSGLGQFRAMLQSLVNWSHFDPYYFDTLKKLKRHQAQKSLDHLRQLQEIRDAKVKEERKRREDAEAARQKPADTLPRLRDRFLELHAGKMNPQQRGYALEEILLELSKLCGLEITEGFRVNGEQIDGAVKYDGEHYLIEAKWHDQSASNEPLYQFAGKVEGKMYGRGIFVSIQGYSEHVVRSLVSGKAIKTILVDGEDLTLVLERHLTFSDLVDRKVKAAQTRGLIYVQPLTGIAKVT